MGSPASILVVDDDDDLRECTCELLRSHGFRAHGFQHGERALRYLRCSEAPGLIVLDLLMPERDGWSFLYELRNDAVLKSIPVVIASAVEGGRSALEHAGIVGYLLKPVEEDDLLALARRHC